MEAEKIANSFASIFGQTDVGPDSAELLTLNSQIQELKLRALSEQKYHFTPRELTQAIRKTNPKSAMRHDGVSNKLMKFACEDADSLIYY
jgi:hypothetical protein